jgi:epoxyqueuosine reductase
MFDKFCYYVIITLSVTEIRDFKRVLKNCMCKGRITHWKEHVMKQLIIEAANHLGIEIIGFTNCLDYSYIAEFLNDRKEKGFSCEFEEQDINKRLNATNVFPKCKSIIALGIPYALGYKKPVSNNMGLLSVSSYGEDYHLTVGNKLKQLAEELKKYIEFDYRICVDTSPLIDREICKNAGIGNYGKNSLLISQFYGSFINLGYLLTDLDIECDKTDNVDICGECDICIKSCPNNAILKEGGINARRCISYLTQTKAYIPLEFRNNMRNQIYGCDVCQLVCPKNKHNNEKTTKIDYSSLLIDLEELLKMSNSEFYQKYGHLSGSWRGKNVWKRNALISIGNLGLTSMFELVEGELNNPSSMIKIYAAWCLLRLNKEKATEILHNKMKYEDDTVISEYSKLLEAQL